MIQNYKISAIKQSDISLYGELTNKVYKLLYETASYKVDDGGFSFFIRKSYLDGLLEDIKADKRNHDDYNYLTDSEIELIQKLYDMCENELLMIDNDDLITKQSRREDILNNKLNIK